MAKKQFKAESKRLLDLMINSIYTHKEIFLREIISNASDACDKLCYQALTDDSVKLTRKDFKSDLSVNKDARTITVTDNGIGMDKGKLTEILAKKDKPVVNTKRGGYGIGNILERLHIYYDDDFMFEIDSAILVGTTVTIRVPYSRNDSPQIHAERPIGGAEQN